MKEYNLSTITEEEVCALHARDVLRIDYNEMSRQLMIHVATLRRFFNGVQIRPLTATVIREHLGIQLNEQELRTVLRLWWAGCLYLDYPKIARLTQMAHWTVKLFFESEAPARVMTIRILVQRLGLTERKLA